MRTPPTARSACLPAPRRWWRSRRWASTSAERRLGSSLAGVEVAGLLLGMPRRVIRRVGGDLDVGARRARRSDLGRRGRDSEPENRIRSDRAGPPGVLRLSGEDWRGEDGERYGSDDAFHEVIPSVSDCGYDTATTVA